MLVKENKSALQGGLKERLMGPVGKAVAIIGALVGVFLLLHSLKSGDVAADASRMRWFVDSESLKGFQKEIKAGDTVPVVSPYSGKNTGYQAELCYWTKDGKPKDTPTPVLLNRFRNIDGPTFCPDCGRLVLPHNPIPFEGTKPPPTKEEYLAKHSR